jgi:hypothetical protein
VPAADRRRSLRSRPGGRPQIAGALTKAGFGVYSLLGGARTETIGSIEVSADRDFYVI